MKVGDYVRIDGYISKAEHIKTSSSGKTYVQWKQPNGLLASGNINIIEKTSPNIIDLIEVGDYVNGCYVTNRQASHNEGIAIIPKRIGIIKCNAYFNQGNYNDCDFKWIEEKDIKSIVTKEQFEEMEYKCE